MRKIVSLLIILAALLMFFPATSRAQNPGDIVLSAGFTFGPLPTTQGATCAPILTWNGVADAYPQDEGAVCAFFYSNIGIEIPWQLGFLNNGFLFPCNQMTWGDKTWGTRADGTPMDGTQEGDTYMQPADTTCPYFTDEYGGNLGDHVLVGFGIIANFSMVQKRVCARAYRGNCYQYKYILVPVMQGGQGTATETQL